ncbi:hypothetical protein F7Q99_12515 [Streptomyces kaniharaensis]|uniref:Uncharacterized protein n=1 Tax=Streptomyces kaniharaensis TaxID=212423 RepID=A0A6N7KNJ5_9ACTN|nr:hypothetical protein [Streptomyces kaniharaensis]MQS13086.1 hypothetical protein [Streptomyces kaniharaensis]
MTDHATPQDNAGTPAEAPAPAPAEAPATPAAPPLPPTVDLLPPPPVIPETPEEREARLARRTRRRKAAVRWATATLVFALTGTGAALAVTAPERTDIPGLATKSDGRYTFPALALPPLPSGKSAPDGKGATAAKDKNRHYADLRYLLLPTPREAGGSLAPVVFPIPTATPSGTASASPSATPSASASPSGTPSASASSSASAKPTGPAAAEWVTCDAVLAEQQNPAKLRELLLQNACRAATVREWTASDGTRTQIRLLRFGSSAEAWDVFSGLRSDSQPKDVPGAKIASHDGWDTAGVDLTVKETSTQGDKGDPTARLAYIGASDVLAVVTMTNPKGVPLAPFRQVVTLQSDLLG